MPIYVEHKTVIVFSLLNIKPYAIPRIKAITINTSQVGSGMITPPKNNHGTLLIILNLQTCVKPSKHDWPSIRNTFVCINNIFLKARLILDNHSVF